MKKFVKLISVALICCTITAFLPGCKEDKKIPKNFELTTERPSKTMVPTITYGCDLYTADLPSIKKMSGMIYRGKAFGEIDEENAALTAAVRVINDVYGEEVLEGYEPIVVTYNDRAGCWIIHGTPQDNRNTGVTFVAIRRESGEVVMLLKNEKDEETK